MPVSGQELLEQSIDNCQQIASGLGTVNADWETSIVEILEKFDEISDTFFFKTMPSVPAARAVVRESESALALRQSEEWDEFGTAITTLIESSQSLIEKAGMKGVTLT